MADHFGPEVLWRCIFQGDTTRIVYMVDDENRLVDVGECFGAVSGHEILKRSRSGADANLLDMENVRLLCSAHQTWVEDNPDAAHSIGLAKHSWEA